MKSDEELKQTIEVFVDENDILRGALLKELKEPADDARRLELMEKAVLEILNKNPQKNYKAFLNILPLGKGRVLVSSGTRKVWGRLASKKQIKKCAVIGLSIFLKTVSSFIINLVGRSEDIKWFSDKEEALEWLKEE